MTEAAAPRGGKSFNFQILRKVVQLISFLLFVAVVFGLEPLPVVLPVMFTLGLQQQAMGDAFAMLQVMLSEGIFPLISLASFFLVAVFLGRSMCGWVCPFGFVQDMVA